MDNQALQTALLDYFSIGKPLLKAADTLSALKPSCKDDRAFRRDIIKVKNALVELGFLTVIPGMKTNGTLYRTTADGRKYSRQLQERMKI